MKCQRGLIGERITDLPVVFSLGAFDGVHLGHQYLLSLGRRLAREQNSLFTVLTFSTLPRQQLFPKEAPSFLTSPFHKRQLLESAGVDILIEVPFSEQLMMMSAVQFLKEVEEMVHIDTWVGGRDLHFGRNQEGGCAFIEQRAEETGMKVVFFERLTASEENVSSTRIRSLVLSGALSQAHALLGRPYSFLAPCTPSKVVHRACSLSAFYVDDSLLCLPPEGDYEATVCLGESRSSYEAILHIYRNELSSRVCEVVVNAEAVPAVDFLEVIPRRFL